MSTRKYDKNFIPIGSKRNTPLSAQRNQDLNLTVRPTTTNVRSRLNMTTCLVTPTPTVDWELKCDLTYSAYLQLLMTNKILTQTVTKHTTSMSDQLSIQADLLSKQIARTNEAKSEIEKVELTHRLKNMYEVLNKTLQLMKRNLSPEVDLKMEKLKTILDCACDKIYLDNVKQLESQEDYDKFEEQLKMCQKILQNVITVAGDVEATQKLANCLKLYNQLSTDIVKVKNSVAQLQEEVACATLFIISDKLADYKGYNEIK